MLANISFIGDAKSIFKTSSYEGMAFLYYFDFAEFKLINRYYGIHAGNALLNAAEVCLKQIPWVRICKRIISDQFIFLVIAEKQRTNEELISMYAEYADAFLAKHRNRYPACNLRTYCGIAPIHNGNVIAALDNANIAWREAKKNKLTNAVVFDEAMSEMVTIRHEREREINLALNEDRFSIYLQPKINLLTGKIIGAEALARRLDPSGNVVYPDSFISIMEENGTIIKLDMMVLQKVCSYMAKRMEKGLPVVRTSINLSRLHVQIWDTAAQIHAIVQQYDIPSTLLEFELTETILLDQFASAKELCIQLRNYGYSVAIDDFGAGYAGVNILQELDFDVLKLDRRFLSDEEPLRSRNEIILPDILHSTKGLRINTICEGVETAAQCRYLVSIGCQDVQGYYFSKPIPPDQFYARYDELNGCYPLSFIEP